MAAFESALKAKEEKSAAQALVSQKLTADVAGTCARCFACCLFSVYSHDTSSTLSLFAAELKRQLEDEVAKNGTLHQELLGTQKTAIDEHTKREQLELGLRIMFSDLQMNVDPLEPVDEAALRIPKRAQDLLRAGLYRGVHKSVSIMQSHYSKLDFEILSKGWALGYKSNEITALEKEMAPMVQHLSAIIEDEYAAGDGDADGGDDGAQE